MTTNEPLKFDLPATALEILPIEYRKNESGIFKIKTREDRDGNVTEEILIPLCYTPLRVSKILENPDTHEVFYIISFPTKNGSGEKDVTVSGGELFQKKGIMALAGQGVIVAEGMVKGITNSLVIG